MAVAKFKSKSFADYLTLAKFVATDSSVSSVVSIIHDSSGQYILFYLTP